MTLDFDSKTMHRVIGAGVWVVLLAIVMPGMMDRAARLAHSPSEVPPHLPEKPALPAIAIHEERQVFASKPMASVDLATPVANTTPPLPTPPTVQKAASEPLKTVKKPPVVVEPPRVKAPVVATKVSAPVASAKPGRFAVQLGSFSRQENAIALVQKLKKAGFQVSSQRIMVKQMPMYKVYVGGIQTKEEAIRLQKQLAQVSHINGMIIQSGVS